MEKTLRNNVKKHKLHFVVTLRQRTLNHTSVDLFPDKAPLQTNC